MKPSPVRYSSWLVLSGIFLLCVGMFRVIANPNQSAPKDDIVVIGEALQTLPPPQVTLAAPEHGGNLLPDVSNSPLANQITQEVNLQSKPADSPIGQLGGESGQEKTETGPSTSPIKVRVEDPTTDNSSAPIRILIPAIGLDAQVVPAKLLKVKVSGYLFDQWAAPDQFAVGWHPTSAGLGEIGNTVLNGHHNDHGEVFRRLVELKSGDSIMIFSQQGVFSYTVTNTMILQEVGVTLNQRMENSRWIAPSTDERITLVTCWPYESNTHRLVIVAKPTP